MTNEITTSCEIDYDCEDFNGSKRPKMTSKVWEEMQRIQTTEGSKVLCKYCGKLLQDNCGTSHLKRHLVICPKRPKPIGVTQDSMYPVYLSGTDSAKDSGFSKALMVRPLKVEPQSQVICFSPTPNYGTGAVTIASIDNASNSIVELNHRNSSTLLMPSLDSSQNQEELSLDDAEMKAFYASLDVETSFKSPAQDTTVITGSSNTTTPCEETSKALKTLQDLLSKEFSVLLQAKQCCAMKSTIEYLSNMSSVKGISSKMKLLILEVSREFTRWSCDYNDASKKIESASSNIAKADKLEESLEANKNEFKEVLSLENELCNQLATLEQRKKELEDQINAIKANISVFQSAKFTAAKRKREVFEEAKALKAQRDELKEQVPQLKDEREMAKKIQENIQVEWLKLGEKFNKSLNGVNSEDMDGKSKSYIQACTSENCI